MEDLRKRETLVQMQVALQQKQYAQLATHQAEIRRMHHDMKRHLRIIGQYLSDERTEQALDYIRQQEVVITEQMPTITGYGLLDGVLAAKKADAQAEHIRWQCEAHLAAQPDFPEADVAIILDNALDNAIEAVVQVPDMANRWLEMTISQQQGLVTVMIRNTTIHEPIAQHEKILPTTKADDRNHGLGLERIRQSAQKHHGTIAYACDGMIFTLHVMLSVPLDGIDAAETAFVPKP